MDTARPFLAEIIDQVVSNAEKECVGFALAGMKMFLANRISGLCRDKLDKIHHQSCDRGYKVTEIQNFHPRG